MGSQILSWGDKTASLPPEKTFLNQKRVRVPQLIWACEEKQNLSGKKLNLSSSDTEVEKNTATAHSLYQKQKRRIGGKAIKNEITMETRCLKSRNQFLLCPFKLSSDCWGWGAKLPHSSALIASQKRQKMCLWMCWHKGGKKEKTLYPRLDAPVRPIAPDSSTVCGRMSQLLPFPLPLAPRHFF